MGRDIREDIQRCNETSGHWPGLRNATEGVPYSEKPSQVGRVEDRRFLQLVRRFDRV